MFFWSKLGLLLTLNIAFWVAWKNRVHHLAGFAPHFALLTWIALANLSGGECDTYYSHPNGSIGQMTLESMGFSILGLTIIRKWRYRGRYALALAVTCWNGLHVALFYAGLTFTNHWTWTNTFFVTGGLLAFSLGATRLEYREQA